MDTTQCRGGLDHILPGVVVDSVGDEAEVAHGGAVALESHLLVVPGGAQVNMANIHVEVVATKIFWRPPIPPALYYIWLDKGSNSQKLS